MNIQSIQTHVITENLHLTLHLFTFKETINKRVQSLVEAMISSPLFSTKDKEVICKWKMKINQTYLPQLTIDCEISRNKFSRALALILINLINPTIARSTNEFGEDFDDQLKTIIRMTLPSNKEVEAFVHECEESIQRAKIHNAKLQCIPGCFEDETNDPSLKANAIKHKIEKQFQANKKSLLTLNTSSQESLKKVYAKLDVQEQLVGQLIASTAVTGACVQSVARQWKSQEQKLQNLIEECKAIVPGDKL